MISGVYLSRYSDLLQVNTFEPGTTGDIIVFKIMKVNISSLKSSHACGQIGFCGLILSFTPRLFSYCVFVLNK